MKNIMIPTDFSQNASQALQFAINMSQQLNCGLLVYHCSYVSGLATPSDLTDVPSQVAVTEDEKAKQLRLHKQVADIYQSLGVSTIPSTTKVEVEFNPALVEAIIAYAQKENAALIITGTHGASGIEKFFFGSNTSQLIAQSPIPVLAIPQDYDGKPIRNICFSSDLENLQKELDQLLPIVQLLNASLSIVHFDYGKDPQQLLLNQANQLIQEVAYHGVSLHVEKATVELPLLKQIKNYIAIQHPDAIVMFTRERSLWDKLLLRSKTEDMSSALEIPLLSFKKR
ncbi:MAG: universal stress protein [Chitinophagaceae bacterium]|nr:MAG: universal stress protein [Chitinophagaceae bacterium]